ncbi:MAG: Coenzyme F420 hydrogenase/dehydrogenase, beta subunit C-terminal domain, partial [Candidatus Aminicenantes bacterium]|nr:Coenzyme F420 hydrogenase/dehydrogenase, beta subunit C-terminal domain [Candidatus Aminicenantes bacterium]
DRGSFRGAEGDSLYIPSFANRVFRDAPPDRPVLAIGLPCQAYGLQLLQERMPALKSRVLVRISLFCGLTFLPSGVGDQIRKQGADPEALIGLRFRDGRSATATLKDGRILRLDKDKILFSHMCGRCALCPDQTGEAADVSCGDAWLERFGAESDLAWSLVVSRTEAGLALLRRSVAEGFLWAMRAGEEELLQAQRPMLHFKKKTLGQRLLLHRLLGGATPAGLEGSIPVALSPRIFLGNLLLLAHLRLRRFRACRWLLRRDALLGVFNLAIRLCLYADPRPALRRVTWGGLLRRFDRLLPLSRLGLLGSRWQRLRLRMGSRTSRLHPLPRPMPGESWREWAARFPGAFELLKRRAENYLQGRVEIFTRPFDLARQGWRVHPGSGRRYPLLPPFLSHRYGDFRIFGDVKDAFELHKHYPFVELCLLYRLTGRQDCLRAVSEGLESWSRAFPPGAGVAWVGNVHVAQRMVAWMFVFVLLDGVEGSVAEGIRRRIATGLREHAAVLRPRRHVPANNHRLGSLCALLMHHWLRTRAGGRREAALAGELSACVDDLVSPAGAPKEGSLAYGRLVLEFLLLLKLFAGASGRELPAAVLDRSRSMVCWFSDLLGPEESLPPLGDLSDEHAFPFEPCFQEDRNWLELGRELFFTAAGGEATPLSALLCGRFGAAPPAAAPLPAPGESFVDAGGRFGRVSRRNRDGRWTAWMRGGEFGLPPGFAHAHSDLLAPVIRLDGRAVMTEAGVFRYNVASEERMSDVLSQGHSGIRCDMGEQAVWRGRFAWGGEPLSAALSVQPGRLSGEARLPDGTRIGRAIRIHDDHLEIEDAYVPAPGGQAKLLQFNFIFFGEMEEKRGGGRGAVILRLHGTNDLLEVRFDRNLPPASFRILPARISEGYGVSGPGIRIVLSVPAAGAGAWQTRLGIL